jgi:single-strand DNA-binding protein
MLKIEAIGNIGSDATIKQINGRDALSFAIAHSERRNGEESTIWVDCLYFTNNPDRLQPYLTKGKSIHVRGNMSVSTYTTRDGMVRINISCYVSELDFCGNNPSASQQQENTRTAASPTPPSPTYYPPQTQDAAQGSDDLPF